MKHNFESWIDEQHLDQVTTELFQEGISCYKSKAYRASLLFSYLGLQAYIKSKLNVTTVPEGYTEGEWEHKVRSILQDDFYWDHLIFKLVEENKKPVFKISKEIFNQYVYWKDRRNDCAHAKGNQISYPHVESFWLFLQSNMSKFVVNGGVSHIIKLVHDHIDIKLTPRSKSIEPIVNEIVAAVEENHYINLWDEVLELFSSKFNHRKMFDFFSLALNHSSLQKSASTFFKGKIQNLTQLLQYDPSLLYIFNDEKTVRQIWINFKHNHEYPLFISILRNDMIPIDQKEEAFEYILSKVDTTAFNEDIWDENLSITSQDLNTLKESGFIHFFYVKAFNDKLADWTFAWGNRNRYLITYYLSNFPIDKEVGTTLNMLINYPNTHTHAKRTLLSYLRKENSVLESYIEFCREENLECQLLDLSPAD